jgi:CDP-paratose 2-epimerase
VSVAIVTGSSGLVGSESVRFLSRQGLDLVGIDNDMRATFFGPEASTKWTKDRLIRDIPGFRHFDVDIRDRERLESIFSRYGRATVLIVHAAAQPSHDWAARDPLTDFTVNANGTLNLLESARRHCPDAVFIFTSTNKVYGDRPNQLPLVERATRWELCKGHAFYEKGIDESMSLDDCLHSLFGASKVAADVLVQEFGRYYGMKTVCFRGGCLTGPGHAGAPLHGFLAYLMKCTVGGRRYVVQGYSGKQVRDNIHSADLVSAFWAFFQRPRSAAIYNIGGGRFASCSMLEAIKLCEEVAGRPLEHTYEPTNRIGDHIWWISDTTRFERHYPDWRREFDLRKTLEQIHEGMVERLSNS